MSGTPSDSSSARSPFSLSYRLLVGVRFFGSFPIQMQAIILGWQMYQFTRNPLDLGLIGLVEATPAIGLALFAGYFVDRTNPRLVILGVLFVSALSLFLAAIAKSPNELFLAALLTGIARSFYSPSIQSLIPRLVPRMAINRAIAASNSAMKLAYVSGPAAGGLLLGWVGATGAYSIGGLFFLTAFIAVFLIKYEHSRFVMPSRNEKRFLDELLAGIRFVFRKKIMLAVLSLDMFAVLFGGVVAILPMVAEEILHTGPEGLGLLRASPAMGALAMSVWLVRNPINRGAGKILLWSVAGFGICILSFAASRNVALSSFFLFLSGALDGVSMVVRGSIVQILSPESMRGRVASVNSIFIGSSNEIGAFESGVAASLLGLIPSIFFGGAMTLATVYLVAKSVPELGKIDLDRLSEES